MKYSQIVSAAMRKREMRISEYRLMKKNENGQCFQIEGTRIERWNAGTLSGLKACSAEKNADHSGLSIAALKQALAMNASVEKIS